MQMTRIATLSSKQVLELDALEGRYIAFQIAEIDATAHTGLCHCRSPIPCGGLVRLQHLNTKKFLHSHLHSSPLSQNQEVSAFDEQNRDDNWKIECLDGQNKEWMREARVRIVHAETLKYLHASGKQVFRYYKVSILSDMALTLCRNPIPGQLEVCGVSHTSADSVWVAKVTYMCMF
jgi:hypothetical protein